MPENQKIYHITHIRNLRKIAQVGCLWSENKCHEMTLDCAVVGMKEIKRRRLEELDVGCHPGTMVGHYVPFYFCPRSIMLYILHMSNHPDLNYTEGQRPIVHMQADLMKTIKWAEQNNVRWAFSAQNAGTRYENFYCRSVDFDKVGWAAVRATDFRSVDVRDKKQAEFLVLESFPWLHIEAIGVIDDEIAEQAKEALADSGIAHKPDIKIVPDWYY